MIKKNPITSWCKESYEPQIDGTAYVDETASVIGNVKVGKHVYIGPQVSVRADEGMPIEIGDESNLQDGVIVHCLKHGSVKIGKRVSLAHGCIIHGPTEIGDSTFIGFGSVVHKSKIGKNCVILHNATVIGVEIPDGKVVPTGAVIDSQQKVEELKDVDEALTEFKEEVVEVNLELCKGYKNQ
ncbi:MAG: carbonate dehydratase [Candidatus Aenigmarchaeota archaeon]|nr:carbonate dehydratase [Candidatus Aenigmarchaeota archaeon]